MKNKLKPFTWYATHPVDGELILYIMPKNSYRQSLIYAPRMIFERLRGRMNQIVAMELNLGPVGFVPWQYYEEAGIFVRTPFQIRLLAITNAYLTLEEDYISSHDAALNEFMLARWKMFTKKSSPVSVEPDESFIDRSSSPGTNPKG